ncbi:hypothetical protein EGW08_003235 [Elysia chlorotica]|uniref:Uncharacterized protein n=1 Tax=Elysia chlorotica TaxID=188477 RepID=A0A433U5N2_ELYCH|nr:hypothetical protein EGW08_003235 [Elysia chlorotica]
MEEEEMTLAARWIVQTPGQLKLVEMWRSRNAEIHEPYENFISFDKPDEIDVDNTVFDLSAFEGDRDLEIGLRNEAPLIFHAPKSGEFSAHGVTHIDTLSDDQQLESSTESDPPPLPLDLERKPTMPETADPAAENSATSPNAQIKDKALCVNYGATVCDPNTLEDHTDFPPSDKNNRPSGDGHFQHNSINMNRTNEILSSSEDSERLRYDPIGLSMASYRSSGVVCHCLRSCRKSSLTFNLDAVRASPSEASPSRCDSSSTPITSPSSPIHVLSQCSSKSSVSSYFSLAPEGEQFWNDALFGENLAASDAGRDVGGRVPDQGCEKSVAGSATTDSGWSDGESLLGEALDLDCSTPDVYSSCACQLCGCAERVQSVANSGPFSSMWDWTFPTVEDVDLAGDPSAVRGPGDYRLGSPRAGTPGLSLTGRGGDQPGFEDSLVYSSSSPAVGAGRSSCEGQAQTLSHCSSSQSEQPSQPVVTLFNHSLNFWKMEVD